jgi:hypothetical protein
MVKIAREPDRSLMNPLHDFNAGGASSRGTELNYFGTASETLEIKGNFAVESKIHLFLGIPAKLNAGSGRKPNGIPG